MITEHIELPDVEKFYHVWRRPEGPGWLLYAARADGSSRTKPICCVLNTEDSMLFYRELQTRLRVTRALMDLD